MNAILRRFAAPTLTLVLFLLVSCTPQVDRTARFDVVETSIPEMQAALAEGRVTSRELAEAYLVRIAMYEEGVNATMQVNPRALEIADSLDRNGRRDKSGGHSTGSLWPSRTTSTPQTCILPVAPWRSKDSPPPTRPPSPET